MKKPNPKIIAIVCGIICVIVLVWALIDSAKKHDVLNNLMTDKQQEEVEKNLDVMVKFDDLGRAIQEEVPSVDIPELTEEETKPAETTTEPTTTPAPTGGGQPSGQSSIHKPDSHSQLPQSYDDIVVGELYPCEFVRAKDGDTFVVKLMTDSGSEITVRLIGVDTPESVAPESYYKENTEEGKKVSDIVKEKFYKGQPMYIEFDVSQFDRYQRFLGYLWYYDSEQDIQDGRLTMVQDWLLTNGLANVATFPPNVAYADHFVELAAEARENGVGLWAVPSEDDDEATSEVAEDNKVAEGNENE